MQGLIVILFGIFVFGLALGSFVNALVWRLHENMKKKKPDPELSVLRGRSMCTMCNHKLAAKDLIPLFSWVSLGGKCRYCKNQISGHYPLVELLTASLFGASYLFWPYPLLAAGDLGLFGIWLALVTIGVTLSLYDFKWMELPNRLVYAFGGTVVVWSLVLTANTQDVQGLVSSIIGSLGFGGFFYVIYQVSGGKWIGGGDVRLGFLLGLLLGWQKSVIGLTLAAYSATILIAVLVITKKYHKQMKVPFGPFLLMGSYVAILWGGAVIDWYLRTSGVSG